MANHNVRSYENIIKECSEIHDMAKTLEVDDDKEINEIKERKSRKSLFVKIDRKMEDSLVVKYQNSHNQKDLEQLYTLREQTLRIWAKKYHYLSMSEEDMLSEVTGIWLKCIEQYEIKAKDRAVRTKNGKFDYDENGKVKIVHKKTPFNTFLFTSLKNHMSNISKRRHCKKKIDSSGKPIESGILSLNYEYGNNSSGNTHTLADFLVAKNAKVDSGLNTESLINDISCGDKEIEEALSNFASDYHNKKISTACQNVIEKIDVAKKDLNILRGKKSLAKKRLREIIGSSGKYPNGFTIKKFMLDNNYQTVTFELRRKDTYILRKTKKALEKYRQKITKENYQ